MKSYRQALTATPQRTPIDTRQVLNRAGGWVYPITPDEQLWRFLVLGSADGSYYASGHELTKENLAVLDGLLKERGPYVVEQIALVSQSGRAPKNDAAILALAYTMKRAPDPVVRRLAANMVPHVCRTAMHLYQLADAIQLVSDKRIVHVPQVTLPNGRIKAGYDKKAEGWSHVARRAIREWFEYRDVDSLAYQAVKYRQREGWKLRDLLRLSHPKPYVDLGADMTRGPIREHVYDFILGKPQFVMSARAIIGYEMVKRATSSAEVALHVREYRLPWEAVPTEYARDVVVQEALLELMPATALIRQLGRLTSMGVDLAPAVQKLDNHSWLERSRIHPFSLWLALRQYQSGHGNKGKQRWLPDARIVAALERAFMASFKVGHSTGKRLVIGVDCSGSMRPSSHNVGDIDGLCPAEAASVMAWVLLRMEPDARVIAFDTTPIDITQAMLRAESPSQAYEVVRNQLGGGTDCAVPIAWACQYVNDADGFVILTDNESWAGNAHVTQALAYYRQLWSRPTRMVTVDLVASGYSIADRQADAGSMGVVGLDPNVPALVQAFIERELPEEARKAA